MKEIELYDIITLDDNIEYTILKIINQNNNTYYLIAPIDQDEIPDMEKIKIVESKIENNQIIIEDITDNKLLKDLSKTFLKSLGENLEEM